VKGLRARGGFEVDIKWENGLLKTVNIRSLLGNPVKVSYRGKISEFILSTGKEIELNGYLESI